MSAPRPETPAEVPLDDVLSRGWDDDAVRAVNEAVGRPGADAAVAHLNAVQIDVVLRRHARGLAVEDRLSETLNPDRIVSRPRRRRRSMRSVAGLTAAAAAVFAAVCTVGAFLAPAPRVVGRVVTMSEDAAWVGADRSVGSLLRVGAFCDLAGGSATVRTADGVVLRIESSTRLTFVAEDEVALDAGTVLAHVPPEAVGFAVETPDARVVDLGTRFRVAVTESRGTAVTVDEGRVVASLAEGDRLIELDAGRSAVFDRAAGEAAEVVTLPDWSDRFEALPRPDRGLLSLSDRLRTFADAPASLTVGDHPTDGYAAVLREASGVTLDDDLVVATARDGETAVIPAGTVVDSYLVHWDPPLATSTAVLGTLTFGEPVLGVIADTESLLATDATLGHGRTRYARDASRGFEPRDIWNISPDRHGVSVHPGIDDLDRLTDELRVVTVARAAPEPGPGP